MHVFLYMCTCMQMPEDQKMALGPLELELQVVVSSPMWEALNSYSFEKYQALTTDPSLQPLNIIKQL